VKAHAHEIEAQLNSGLDQLERSFHISAELHAKTTHGVLVVGDYTQNALGIRMVLLDLVELELVVERHILDTHLVRILDVRGLFAWIRKDDTVRCHAEVKHTLDLVLAGAVEASAQEGEQLEQHAVRVAFDCIVRLDARQSGDPVYVLVAYILQVDDIERIFFDIVIRYYALDYV